MARFGGWGGIAGWRPFDPDNAFEAAVERALGDRAEYTFRSAGDLVAAIRGGGDYMDWYCRSESGVVVADIARAMAKEGFDVGGGVTGRMPRRGRKSFHPL